MRIVSLASLAVAASLLLVPWLPAQVPPTPPPGPGDEEPPAVPQVVQPGKGPQISFSEGRWEFWWYFNRDALLGLRPSLLATQPGNAPIDQPFTPPDDAEVRRALIPPLVRALRDSNPEVRIAALHALAKSHDPGVRPYLYQGLHDAQFLVRKEAVLALGVWGHSASLPWLEEILADRRREQQDRVVAALAVGLMGGAPAEEAFRRLLSPAIFKEHPSLVQAALAHAAGVGGAADNAAQLRALLADKQVTDFQVRSLLALSLGKIGAAEDFDLLRRLLSDENHQVRRSAAVALGVLGRRGGDPQLVEALGKVARDDSDLVVRAFSLISLGYVGGEAALKFLRAELEQASRAVRPFIALALGLIGDPDSVPLLQRHFQAENDLSYRGALAIGLGLHRDARAAADLRRAFREASEPVLRSHLALALGMLGDVDVVPDLTKVFTQENDVELIPNAAIALGLIGDRTAVDELVARLRKEKNEFVRQSLAYALGLVGDRTAIVPLTETMNDGKEAVYVRAYAATALGLLGDAEPLRAIAKLSRDSNYTMIANFITEQFMTL